jgi:Fic family protein
MNRELTGEFIVKQTGDETVSAFVPHPLPPKPPLVIDPSLREAFDLTLLSLGRLDSIAALLPDIDLFLYMYIRKEAVLSSQIEGTQTSLSDLLLFELKEAPGAPLDDVVEVSNYVAAMNHGLKRLKEGFHLSNRLIREVHEKLLARGRGSDKNPGEFRRDQNWIGGTRPGNAIFVPPPPDRVPECMSALEKFLHDIPEKNPILVKAALAHVQFETIHPFSDGNGRIGRLLITLLLCHEGVLRQPLLYLSLYFKQNRSQYFDLLMKVRQEGDWEAWLRFFVEGVREMAEGAVTTARRLNDAAEEDRKKIRDFGRKASSALRVHGVLQGRPIANIPFLSSRTKISPPTVTSVLEALQKVGIVKEVTGRKRNRLYAYGKILDILRQGTEI